MTAPLPPTAGVARALERLGVRVGAEVDLDLLAAQAPDGRRGNVTGRLEELITSGQAGRDVEALVVRTATAAVSVVPWHAVARVIVRTVPPHPANA